MLEVEFAGTDVRATGLQPLVADLLASSLDRIGPRADMRHALTLLLTDTNEISQLHARFFGDPSDTDVMSFPGDERPTDGSHYLGDIAISLDVAGVQAEREQHSLQREVSFLALHGLLHLLGYNDENDGERATMLRLQTDLLEAFEAERGYGL